MLEETKKELRQWIATLNGTEEMFPHLSLPATNRDQLLKVLKLRYEPAHIFERVIDHLLRAIAREGKGRRALVRALQQNLAEERGIGEADYGPAHILGRRAFFRALGINYKKWEATLGKNFYDMGGFSKAARELIGTYWYLTEISPIAGGAFMLYWEGRIPRLDYKLLLERVDETFGFPVVEGTISRQTPMSHIPPRWHLQSHAEHDKYHEEDLINGVIDSLQTEEEAALVKVAIVAARTAWDRFWLELKEEVF